MSRSVALVLAFVVAGCGGTGREPPMPTMKDEEAVRHEIQAFSEAWSRGDARSAASFYTEDGMRVGAAGDIQHGRAELEAAYDRLLHGPFTGATVKQEPGTVRMLTSDLAVWQGRMSITPPGSAPPLEGYVVQIMKRVGDRWLVLEAHPKLFPPPRR